ncbi:LD-carboxypeptidase [Jiulongibacter sediminis]|jgi:muramoyltetrapeptide carboxypeptidase|uniref:S66 peptidase family protein n=1 Tax=Jiulongibacter sediminis TaxID=1605367 RepID=UPI0026EF1D56|nr:LD-carboxypeptidase [Jiulongibacter sediminis]
MTEVFKTPTFLKAGDTIGVVSVASKLDRERYEQGKSIVEEEFGLKVRAGDHIFDHHFNYAGEDEVRLEDLQQMLDNPNIKAIIAGRGGYGTTRIIDQVDWTSFKKNPKWLVGFSDITALHAKIQSIGYQSIHGPMMVTMTNEQLSTDSLKNALFGEPLDYIERGHSFNREGNCKGPIIGGNLCLLAHNVGSSADLDFEGKILFIEDIGEYYYNIDRMMVQLKRAGKLEKLSGLIVGQFSNSKENSTLFGKTANEIVQEHTAEYIYPVCYDFPIGHEDENRAVRCGEVMELNITKNQVSLKTSTPYV